MKNKIEQIKEAVQVYLNEKMYSPFYSTLIASWLVWNWKIIYITFFIDSNLLAQQKNLLKIEYLQFFYSFSTRPIETGLHLIVLPVVSTYLIIYILNPIASRFLVKYLQNHNNNELITLEKERELLKLKESKLNVFKQAIKIQKEEERIEDESKTQEQKWQEEYNDFKNSPFYPGFTGIEDSIYQFKGDTKDLDPEIKAYCDSNDIITIGDNSFSEKEKIELTDKGKYFMKNYKNENGKRNIRIEDVPF